MKETIFLIADNEAENYGRKLMLDADNDDIRPGTYFCYKILDLSRVV